MAIIIWHQMVLERKKVEILCVKETKNEAHSVLLIDLPICFSILKNFQFILNVKLYSFQQPKKIWISFHGSSNFSIFFLRFLSYKSEFIDFFCHSRVQWSGKNGFVTQFLSWKWFDNWNECRLGMKKKPN